MRVSDAQAWKLARVKAPEIGTGSHEIWRLCQLKSGLFLSVLGYLH